jgi:hypothetical protein
MEDSIQPYRQPLVTATGIILGFILNFAASFVKSETVVSNFLSYLIAISIIIGIICLIIVLNRILKMDYPKEKGLKYYKKTLNIFIFGVSISFVGVVIDLFSNFMSE